MLQKCSVLKVAGIFFTEPTSNHYLVEISRKASLAHTSTKKHLLYLKKQSIIVETNERRGKRNFPIYKSNLDSHSYKRDKKTYNLLMLEKSGLIEFIKDKFMPRSIVLFGSYQKGEDIENSDIDLFVECKKESLNLSKFIQKLKRNVQLHFKDNFKKYPSELKNNIINGVVLDGYLEAF